jgi:hypothetical protein
MAPPGALSVYSNVDRPELVVPPLASFGAHDQDFDDGLADQPFLAVLLRITYTR